MSRRCRTELLCCDAAWRSPPAPCREEAAHNAVGDVGNVVGWCWIDQATQRADVLASAALNGLMKDLSRGLAHGRGVGWHVDEPDVGMRLHTDGKEVLTDVHGTHVHEADPWGLLCHRGS